MRNEHVPSAKAKMCSELMGNHETDTETISEPAYHDVKVQQELTDCNTNFIYGVVDMNRFFKPTGWIDTANQDGKVMRIHTRCNLVCSNRMLQGVLAPWT